MIKFPYKLSFLFEPKRYKCAYGGRGGAKSWAFADALLIMGAQRPLRVLCARETQKSIRESVHQLLTDRIVSLGLEHHYQVLDTEIRGKNGTEFVYTGLASHTVTSIKSFEGADVCWVEEAQGVKKKSWDILIPTIRKPGSEIWVSMNPDLDTDDSYVRFVLNAAGDPDIISVEINYSDNPWFPDVLEKERVRCQEQRPRDYDNIWLGKPRAAVEGAIYAEEVDDLQKSGRACHVYPEETLKTHIIFDLGWNDSMSIILAQRMGSELRILEYIEDDHKTLSHYSQILKDRKLNWGTLWLPHDGAHKDFKYGKSAQQIMTELGWSVQIIPIMDIEHGIRTARMTFPRVYVDKDKASGLIECLKRYRRTIPQSSGEPGSPLHDQYSHGADCFRYTCSVADQMTNDEWGGKLNYPKMKYA